MHLPRLLGLATLVACASALLLPTTSVGATPNFHDGQCVGTEGVTVIVDANPSNDSSPSTPVKVRCAIGDPASGIEALQIAGYSATAHTNYGDPFICSIDGFPLNCHPNDGYWAYYAMARDGSEWSFSMDGAAQSDPVVGATEGWRWVEHYMQESLPPRAVQAPPVVAAASIGVPSATVTSAHGATVTASVTAGGASQQVHVEYTSEADRSRAARTTAAAVAAGSVASPVFALSGLASNTTFSYRVVSTGTVGVVTSAWATFTTPRATARLKVTPTDRFVQHGARVAIDVDRLAAAERVTVRIGTQAIGSANADQDGEARVVVRIPRGTDTGTLELVATGSTSDRVGQSTVTVTARAKLDVSAESSRVAVQGHATATVSGLASSEPVVLRWRGSIVARGTASVSGTFTARVAVGRRPGTYVLVAIGSHATRRGITTIVVDAAPRRRG